MLVVEERPVLAKSVAPRLSVSSAICLLDRVFVPSRIIVATYCQFPPLIGIRHAATQNDHLHIEVGQLVVFKDEHLQSIAEFCFIRLRKRDLERVFIYRGLALYDSALRRRALLLLPWRRLRKNGRGQQHARLSAARMRLRKEFVLCIFVSPVEGKTGCLPISY